MEELCGLLNVNSSVPYNSDSNSSSLSKGGHYSSDGTSSTEDQSDVFWDELHGIFTHHSVMHYRPQRNTYFTYITSDPNDFRALYYVPSNGVLKLANHGRLGANNKQLLAEKYWDKSTFYSKYTCSYHPDLLSLFKKIIESDFFCKSRLAFRSSLECISGFRTLGFGPNCTSC